MGPMLDPDTPPLLPEQIEVLHQHLTLEGGDYRVTVPQEQIVGMLKPFNGRARVILERLLNGYSMGMAAACAGVDTDTVRGWGRRHPEFRAALNTARDWGFRRTAESELQRRALAGSDDRASARLLELWVKREDAAYREKSQIQMDVIHRADERQRQVAGSWQPIDGGAEVFVEEE